MRKLALALAAIAAMTSVAHADNYDWQHRHYEGHRDYRGGYRGGNGNWIAPLIGGMIVGGALMEMNQPRYVELQSVCQKVYVGNIIVDGRLVRAFQTVCD